MMTDKEELELLEKDLKSFRAWAEEFHAHEESIKEFVLRSAKWAKIKQRDGKTTKLLTTNEVGALSFNDWYKYLINTWIPENNLYEEYIDEVLNDEGGTR